MRVRYGEPLFVISVAARLVEMHPQTLRKYEREGLIAPSRTSGNLRLYSDRDIERLRQVKYLVEVRGLNLAGVQLALELTGQLRELRSMAALAVEGEPATGETNGTHAPYSANELQDRLAILWASLEDALQRLGHLDQRPTE